MTSNPGQAKDWAKRMAARKSRDTGKAHTPLVVRARFAFRTVEEANELRILAFVNADYNNGFWSFVCGNRDPKRNPLGDNRGYDIVIGPVANSFNPEQGLTAWQRFDQYSFHSEAAIKALSPLEPVDGD